MSEHIQYLKPCPFCGGKPKGPKTYCKNGGMDGHYFDWIISCSECGATLTYPADGFYGRNYDNTSYSIVSLWNRRDGKFDENRSFPLEELSKPKDEELTHLQKRFLTLLDYPPIEIEEFEEEK